jgi:hypothetical protein
MKDQKFSAAGAAQKPFANRKPCAGMSSPGGEQKGLPTAALAKASAHLWFKSNPSFKGVQSISKRFQAFQRFRFKNYFYESNPSSPAPRPHQPRHTMSLNTHLCFICGSKAF